MKKNSRVPTGLKGPKLGANVPKAQAVNATKQRLEQQQADLLNGPMPSPDEMFKAMKRGDLRGYIKASKAYGIANSKRARQADALTNQIVRIVDAENKESLAYLKKVTGLSK